MANTYFIVQPSDFTGFYKLAQTNNTTDELQAFIKKWEKHYMYQIYGQELADLIIADIGTGHAPVTQRFIDVFNPFHLQDGYRRIQDSQGLKEALIAFIFYHYVFDTQSNHSQSGVITNLSEDSTVAGMHNAVRYAERRFNNALDTVDAIQWFCKFKHTDVYPEYMGLKIRSVFNGIL